jgi:polysaccharide chain length determinant protein (PEP-CTERM system associated)
MVPGKRYTVDDYLKIGWRRKWLLLIPFVVIAAGTVVVAQYLPDRYLSETTILVVSQRVPEDYVQGTVATAPQDRLLAINQQILSRSRLEQIIQEFTLYAEERQTMIMQDVIDRMRRDIGIHITKGEPTFRISYIGSSARTTMQVTERLASFFIDENLRDRAALAESTNQFLEAQLQDARARLIAHEKKLEKYRLAHAGELPSQLQANLQSMQNLQLQLQALTQSLSQDRDRRLMIERLLADASAPEPVPTVDPVAQPGEAAGGATAGMTAGQQLEAARRSLRAAELRLKPDHPDIGRLKRAIKELEQRAEAEALEQPLSPDAAGARPMTPAEAARATRLAELRAQMESLERQIGHKQEEEQRLKTLLASYQARVSAVPTREAELVELTRDYETLQQIYTGLLQKKETSNMAVNLERRQIGEQFRIIDPARLPERPVSPDRVQISMAGALGGAALGVLLLVLLEYRDTSLRSEDDVVAALGLPAIALVPLVFTATERRRRRRRQLASLAAVAVALVLSFVAVAWKLQLLQRWMN